MDTILSLALSIQSNPGIYALLLGSGVSRAAQIPTGWEITLDLVRKVAAMVGESPPDNLETWFSSRYGESPDYSKVLAHLGRTSAERQQLLRSYFEPTEDEREERAKTPTTAHHAIARMAAKGYFRVIITTNFDRLVERALEEIGIVPTVISSADAVKGAPPIVHSGITIIKVHGDYLDSRIKNTPTELATYAKPMRDLLDRIFDEFGLIIVGWSANWDVALKAAVERSTNHRYGTYWGDLTGPNDTMRRLLRLRRGEFINILGADQFFSDLAEKVLTLEDLKRPHPVSIQVATQITKRYLPEPKHMIKLHDFVLVEVNRVLTMISDKHFPLSAPYSDAKLHSRVRHYEAASEILMGIIATGCYWGEKEHQKIWTRALGALANGHKGGTGVREWLSLRRYPALLALYAGGIAALANDHYEIAHALLFDVQVRFIDGERRPAILSLIPYRIFTNEIDKRLPGMERKNTAASTWIESTLREPLRSLLPDDDQFIELFDRFEYLLGLAHADISDKILQSNWGPVGSFCWRWRSSDRNGSLILAEEINNTGKDLPLLRAGFFQGDVKRLEETKREFDALCRQQPWY